MRILSTLTQIRWRHGAPLLCLLLLGCGDGVQVTEVGDGVDNMSKFGRAYETFADMNGRPPRSAKELEPELKKLGDPKQLMTSPTDNKPYVIFWGVDPSYIGDDTGEGGGESLDPEVGMVIAHEAEGDGDNVVVFSTMGVLTVTKEQLQKGLPKQR